MALVIRHSFVSNKQDGNDNSVVRPSNWNSDHTITGTVDETMLLFTDITTANVSTLKHGLTPKLPNDAARYLDGTGNWSSPSGGGGGDVTAAGDNNFSGINHFSNRIHLGETPPCDFAQVTVYQTLNNTTNSSMMDVVVTGGGFTDMVGLLVISHSTDDLSNQTSLYVRADNDAGNIGQTAAILIDSPQVANHVSTSYGLLINNQLTGSNQSAAYNIYSAGFSSRNVFEGFVGAGTGNPTYPLVVQSTSGVDGHYGQINVDIVCSGSEAGLRLSNTSNNGRNYTLLSTGTGSNVGDGKFIIGDATAQVPRFEIDATGIITFNNAYNFPNTAGTPGQVLVLDGNNLSWNTISESPITTSYTDQRLLTNFRDPQYGGNADLRVLRIGSIFQNSNQGPNTTWFTMPTAPTNDNNSWAPPAIAASISFFAYYYLHNPNINGNGWYQGMTKGRIEFLNGYSAIETSADQLTNNAVMTFANVSGNELKFNFLGQWDDPNTVCNITLHCVAEIFTSPEYYC